MPHGDPPLTLRELAAIKVMQLRGVNEAVAERLLALEISSVLDLLQHYPRRYLDRTRQAKIAELHIGDEATVLGSVTRVGSRTLRGRRTLTNVVITDGTGSVTLTFFNQQWREKQLKPATEVLVHGKLVLFRGQAQMTSPVIDLVGDKTGRIVPVYPQSEKSGLTTWKLATLVTEAINRSRARGFADPLPKEVRDRFSFVSRQKALEDIHNPLTMDDMSKARKRLVFDELLRVQLELVRRKYTLTRQTAGIAHDMSNKLIERFHRSLQFTLTESQKRVIVEILKDLAAKHPMHRLLQGDVGSGKTVVAVTALLAAVQGGYQGALMAPTEVLAEQHYLSVINMLDGLRLLDAKSLLGERPLRVELLTNSVSAPQRRKVLADLIIGDVDILIGTHALIAEKVEYRALGVVVIDEQHRFGVEQRAALRDKADGSDVADVLVMTATPIPRTAAMTVYGDLDVSVLDEMPAGRMPIVTHSAYGAIAEAEVWDVVRKEVAKGCQAYVVCPLIEESSAVEVTSAQDMFTNLQEGELSSLSLGLLHGRMSTQDKESTMTEFRNGKIDVLVSTTVIEVGVDVANATAMVISDADRFGIAQLHQLRGRVGRGQHQGLCFLLSDPSTNESKARIEAIVATTDGFKLAEVDLELRGEGTIMGERQKGRNDLRLASLRRDKDAVKHAREVAVEIIEKDPDLSDHHLLFDEMQMMLGDTEAEFLMKS